jgi:hypothetical protein
MIRQFGGGAGLRQRVGGQAALTKNWKVARLIEQPPIGNRGAELACSRVHVRTREQPVAEAAAAVDIDP